MDTDLADSLAVTIPSDLSARLQLANEMRDSHEQGRSAVTKYAMAASVAVALFVGGFMLSTQLNQQAGEISKDYEKLLAGVIEHVDERPMTPVWGAARANKTVNTLLASYDESLQIKQLDTLQFGRICPMGEYRGLHATLESSNGTTTFAYIKGEPVGELLDASYDGYITRVKPVRGGNLVIVSRSQSSLEQADKDLKQAMVWDI